MYVPIAGARDLPNPTGFVALVEPDARQDVKDAYELCYREERRLVQQLEELRQVSSPRREQIEASIVRIRVIGWMFVFIVESQTLVKLATAVSSCRLEDDGYDTLGQYFLDHWIKACEWSSMHLAFDLSHSCFSPSNRQIQGNNAIQYRIHRTPSRRSSSNTAYSDELYGSEETCMFHTFFVSSRNHLLIELVAQT